MINIVSSSRYKINRKLVKKTVEESLTSYGLPSNAVVNIVFVGKNKMKTIALKYKKEDVALPVLSFSYINRIKTGESDNFLGEIFICYPQAVLLAAEREKKVDAIILQLIKHGISNILSSE